MTFPPCSATTRRGKPCHFAAHQGRDFCINHDPLYKEQQRENALRGSRRSRELRESIPTRLTKIDLADRASVQAALEVVFRLYLLGLISERRMRLLVRALGVASRNFERTGRTAGTHRGSNSYFNARAQLDRHFHQLIEPEPNP